MTARIKPGSLILSPLEVRMLYQVARIGDIRARYRVGNSQVYALLSEITLAAFAPDAGDGSLPRQEAASEEREWWTVPQVARSTGLSTRTVRLDCQRNELPAVKHGNTWLVSNADAATYIAARTSK